MLRKQLKSLKKNIGEIKRTFDNRKEERIKKCLLEESYLEDSW